MLQQRFNTGRRADTLLYMSGDGDSDRKIVASNRRARANYDLLDTYECGLVLQGSEVKSLREGSVQLAEAFGRVRNGEMWILGMQISPWSHSSAQNGHGCGPSTKTALTSR